MEIDNANRQKTSDNFKLYLKTQERSQDENYCLKRRDWKRSVFHNARRKRKKFLLYA